MGHEGFYNCLLVAMGNVVSALFMYALQAAWLCQRLIDQDYRQNHGSRLKPVADIQHMSEPVEIVSHWSPTQKRQNSKSRKMDTSKHQIESSKKSSESKRRRYHRQRFQAAERRLNSSHPYLKPTDAFLTTVDYVSQLGENLTLRRAFSDINISSSYSEFRFFDKNQNYMSNGNIDSAASVTDQDIFRLIFTNGYVT